jgi:hypothetical protein
MAARRAFSLALTLAVLLAGCLPGSPTPGTPTTAPATDTPTSLPATDTPAPPTATDTAAPPTATDTAAPPTATATSQAPMPSAGYQDDRSTAVTVLESYVNALNLKEYARAYSYWEANAEVEPFPDFEAGFAQTEAITLTTGPLGGEGAAGNLFYTVVAALEATLTGGTQQLFVGCFTLHLAQPAVQATPPFRPLGIRSADLDEVPPGTDPAPLLAAACPPTVPLTPEATLPPGDVGPSAYLDDRSHPVALLRSLFNAINRHEYLRAYSYWKAGSDVGSFEDFEAGYAETESVALVTGPVTGDAGAGQYNYLVPVTLSVETTGGPQTFVGCYHLHLSNPGFQAEPPFEPLGIRAAALDEVPPGTDPAPLMATACDTLPG